MPAYSCPALRADGSAPYAGNAGGDTANIVDPNLEDPYAMNWNFGIETQLSKDYVLTAMYTGSAEVDELRGWTINTMP